MADPRFFKSAGSFSLTELANVSGCEARGEDSETVKFNDVGPLAAAGPDAVSFIDNRRYVEEFERSNAGAIVLAPDLVGRAPASAALLISDDPYRAFALIAQAFYPPEHGSPEISRHAHIDPTAKLGSGVRVDPGAVVGPGAEIGDGTLVGANAVIAPGVVVGKNCVVGSNVTLAYCLIGEAVLIHPGVRVGQDGFGFAPGAGGHQKVPQLGRVLIGDGVEIGANSAIDRGAGPDTVIGAGTKIDNLVHIAHNVEIGGNCLIAGQVGTSGSVRLDDFVMIGGQAGIGGHLHIGPGARIAAQSGVTKDVPAGQTVVGFPAEEAKGFWRKLARLNRLLKGDEGH